jgi:plastocyanin
MHTSRSHRLAVLVLVAGLAVALSACSSSKSKAKTTSPGTSSGVTIANLQFTTSPVAAGSTVTVTNNDSVTHTVTSDDGTSFNVSVDAGKTATFNAPSKAGSFKFHCNIHTTMHGTLTVT